MKVKNIDPSKYINTIKDDIEDPIEEPDHYYYDEYKDEFKDHTISLLLRIVRDFFSEKDKTELDNYKELERDFPYDMNMIYDMSFGIDNIDLEIGAVLYDGELMGEDVQLVFTLDGETKKVDISKFYRSIRHEESTLACKTHSDGATHYQYDEMGAGEHEGRFYIHVVNMINSILVNYCDCQPLDFDAIIDWYEFEAQKHGSEYKLHYLD